ncbi:MAG: thiamine-phosphate kinase [Myxococcota bacterium]|nr:thiamine-phosphate kinase [Myxococcota bacterium]
MTSMDERGRIALLARILAWSEDERPPGIDVGIGDDAAVLTVPHASSRLVWTIDEQVEGSHFRRDFLSWRDIGWRSLMAAASDLAAMGAVPWCALSALVLPDDVDDAALEDIALGQCNAARAMGAPVVGGNLARGPSLSIATTLLGRCERAVERRGARAGDGVWIAGSVGLAAAGLKALERRIAEDDAPSALAPAIAAWRAPRALIPEGRAMAVVAHAAVDVSDGLARDADHVAEASRVCIVLEEARLVADAALVAAADVLGESALDLALYGGEDYALVVASTVPIPGFRRIGEVREGEGLVLRGADGERAIEARGFDHFHFGL